MSLASFLTTVVHALKEAEVSFMLTGSLAAASYGSPRATQDIDLIIEPDSDKLEWSELGDSELQRRDVRELLDLTGDSMDEKYLAHWIAALGLDGAWERVKPRE